MSLRHHIGWLGLLFLLGIISFAFIDQGKFFNPHLMPLHDISTAYLPKVIESKNSAQQYGDYWHSWSPYLFAGVPLFMGPLFQLDYPFPLWLVLFSGIGPVLALKISYFLAWILAGVSMYCLGVGLGWKPRYATIAAIVYIYNGYAQKMVVWGWLTSLNAYTLAPLVILFFYKALTTKRWQWWTLLAAVAAALQIRGGPDLKIFIWTEIALWIMCAWYLLSGKLSGRISKILVVGLIFGLLLGGLSLQRLLPGKEFLDLSNRGSLPWEQTKTRQLSADKLFIRIVEPKETFTNFTIWRDAVNDHVGIIAFLLALTGIVIYSRQKIVWLWSFISLAGIFLSMNIFNTYYFLWKYIPPFAGTRYLDRSLFLTVFGLSLLAALGYQALEKYAEKKQWKLRTVGIVVFSLLIFNLVIFNNSPVMGGKWWNVYDALNDNDALKWISQQQRPFRIQTWETRGIDWGTDLYNIHYDLEHIFGYSTIWHPDFWMFIGIANREPAKLWGILNTKYITSQTPLNESGLSLIYTAKQCQTCFPDTPEFAKAWGPYVYENNRAIPRAFIPSQTLLVLGEGDPVTQITYGILLHPAFEPLSTVIISGYKTLSEVPQNILSTIGGIVITPDSVTQTDVATLTTFKQKGGAIFPDIISGENQISEEALITFLSQPKNPSLSLESSFVRKSFDYHELQVNGPGWVVVSEQYALYKDWHVNMDETTIPILTADGIISALYVPPGSHKLTFTFRPRSLVVGTIVSIVFVLITLIGLWYYRKEETNETPQ